jgi:hypothetical protein
MTESEDAANAVANEQMLACGHNIVTQPGRVFCDLCGGQFALMLLPRLAKVVPISEDE